jgi:hypothetical protein
LLKYLLGAALAATVLGPVSSAKAQQALDFSYTFGYGEVLAGALTGSDSGNYFTVTGIQALTINGQDVLSDVAGDYIGSLDQFEQADNGHNGNGTGVVTLDGTYLDLIVYPHPFDNSTGFYFGYGDVFASYFQSIASVALGNYEDTDIPFVQANWSAQLATIPEPAPLAILGGALPMLALLRRHASSRRKMRSA